MTRNESATDEATRFGWVENLLGLQQAWVTIHEYAETHPAADFRSTELLYTRTDSVSEPIVAVRLLFIREWGHSGFAYTPRRDINIKCPPPPPSHPPPVLLNANAFNRKITMENSPLFRSADVIGGDAARPYEWDNCSIVSYLSCDRLFCCGVFERCALFPPVTCPLALPPLPLVGGCKWIVLMCFSSTCCRHTCTPIDRWFCFHFIPSIGAHKQPFVGKRRKAKDDGWEHDNINASASKTLEKCEFK